MNNLSGLSQLLKAKEPLQMITSFLGGNTQQFNNIMGQINGMSEQEKAQRIADWCNKNGISKEQFRQLIQGR